MTKRKSSRTKLRANKDAAPAVEPLTVVKPEPFSGCPEGEPNQELHSLYLPSTIIDPDGSIDQLSSFSFDIVAGDNYEDLSQLPAEMRPIIRILSSSIEDTFFSQIFSPVKVAGDALRKKGNRFSASFCTSAFIEDRVGCGANRLESLQDIIIQASSLLSVKSKQFKDQISVHELTQSQSEREIERLTLLLHSTSAKILDLQAQIDSQMASAKKRTVSKDVKPQSVARSSTIGKLRKTLSEELGRKNDIMGSLSVHNTSFTESAAEIERLCVLAESKMLLYNLCEAEIYCIGKYVEWMVYLQKFSQDAQKFVLSHHAKDGDSDGCPDTNAEEEHKFLELSPEQYGNCLDQWKRQMMLQDNSPHGCRVRFSKILLSDPELVKDPLRCLKMIILCHSMKYELVRATSKHHHPTQNYFSAPAKALREFILSDGSAKPPGIENDYERSTMGEGGNKLVIPRFLEDWRSKKGCCHSSPILFDRLPHFDVITELESVHVPYNCPMQFISFLPDSLKLQCFPVMHYTAKITALVFQKTPLVILPLIFPPGYSVKEIVDSIMAPLESNNALVSKVYMGNVKETDRSVCDSFNRVEYSESEKRNRATGATMIGKTFLSKRAYTTTDMAKSASDAERSLPPLKKKITLVPRENNTDGDSVPDSGMDSEGCDTDEETDVHDSCDSATDSEPKLRSDRSVMSVLQKMARQQEELAISVRLMLNRKHASVTSQLPIPEQQQQQQYFQRRQASQQTQPYPTVKQESQYARDHIFTRTRGRRKGILGGINVPEGTRIDKKTMTQEDINRLSGRSFPLGDPIFHYQPGDGMEMTTKNCGYNDYAAITGGNSTVTQAAMNPFLLRPNGQFAPGTSEDKFKDSAAFSYSGTVNHNQSPLNKAVAPQLLRIKKDDWRHN